MSWWQSFYNTMINQIMLLRITDLIDVALVSFLVYKALKFIRDTKTLQLLKGVIIIIVITQISFFARLNTVYYILSNFLQLGVIALIVIFQPELRRVLEHTGRSTTERLFEKRNEFDAQTQEVIREIAKASQNMSNSRTGALIVIEKDDNINSLISSGVQISAKVTSELLQNIFVPDTPLHDGAVVIRDYKVELASCVLPLSKNPNIKTSYGTRHRSGIGITEESDAISVIVSEETGGISVAYKGEMNVGFNEDTLRVKLVELISGDDDSESKNGKRIKGKFRRSSLSKRRRDE